MNLKKSQYRTNTIFKMLPTPFQCSTAPTRNVRSITQDISPFLQNLIFQYTNPLPFETEPHSIHTIPLLLDRENI